MHTPFKFEKASGDIGRFLLTLSFIIVLFALPYTPIGFIDTGDIRATTIHIPVIIGSLTLGPVVGASLGAIFGLVSFVNNTINPTVLSFVFSPLIAVPGTDRGSLMAIVICMGPRIMTGIVPYYVDQIMALALKRNSASARLLSYSLSGVAGSAINTLSVMCLVYLIFGDEFAVINDLDPGTAFAFIKSVMARHGLAEAAAAGVMTPAVCKAIRAYLP
jgi:uncharacterized membrane protein